MADSTSVPSNSAEDLGAQEDAAEQLWCLWRQGQRPDVDGFLAQAGPLPAKQIAAVLRLDLRERWQVGERVPAEAYLQRYHDLRAHPDSAIDLIYSEFLLRERRGEGPGLDEYLRRFPEYAEVLRPQIELHQAMASDESSLNLVAADSTETPGSRPAGHARPAWPNVAGYEILGELGRGGMGIVYQARQQGLQRIVALKMILLGEQAHPDQLARFRTEAEAVARLQHPNIVQIHEVGDHAGQPFLSLEFVDGGTFTQRLAAAPQPAPATAELVETLARAIHYAHQRGIVHRDLKPANILLSRIEDGGSRIEEGSLSILDLRSSILDLRSSVPKITDFGLAKHLDADGRQTRSGEILGTPSYMAPEQASGHGSEAGPAVDVYALGAILYEMLTGRPPLQAAKVQETLELVRSAEPVPPRRLQPRLPRDLETICLKCLQKEAGKRYASALALAEDLRRFLAGEPIRARPVGLAERLGRWCRRKPALASLAAALTLVSAGGFAGVTGLWLRAERLRAQADADFQLARESVDQFATRVSDSLRLRQEDLRPLRKELLGTVVPFYEKLLERHGNDAGVQAERGRAYARLADLTAEIEDLARAITFYEEAAAVFGGLAERDPGVREYRSQLAKIHNRLSEAYARTGRNAQAEAGYTEELKLWEQLVQEQPDVESQVGRVGARIRLAGLRARTGRIPQAQAEYERALQVREQLDRQAVPLSAEHQQTFALGHHDLGCLCSRIGQAARAEAELQRALQMQKQLAGRHPDVPDYQHHLGQVRGSTGNLYGALGRLPRAKAEHEKALAIAEQLVQQHPSVLDYLQFLAECRYALASLSTQQSALAVADLEKARDALTPLARQHPEVTTYPERLARLHYYLGGVFRKLGRWPEAVAAGKKAEELFTILAGQQPEVDTYQGELLRTHNLLGLAYLETRQFAQAEAEYQQLFTRGESLVRQHPLVSQYRDDLSGGHLNLGMIYYQTERKPAAEAEILEALRISEALIRLQPEILAYQTSMAKKHNNLAVLYMATGRLELAAAAYRRALEIVEHLVREQPEVIDYAVMLGGYSSNLGRLQERTGDLEASLESFTRAIRTLGAVLGKEPQHFWARQWLSDAYSDRAIVLVKRERYAEAVADWDRALPLDDGLHCLSFRALRADALARSGDHAGAMVEVHALTPEQAIKPDNLYELAWACAAAVETAGKDDRLPSDERGKRAEQYAAHGVALLTRAEAAGLFQNPDKAKELKTDVYLDALRSRADFQKLFAEVEKKAP